MKNENCSFCNGSGKLPCSGCAGTGKVKESTAGAAKSDSGWAPCARCNGKGEITCPRCKGSGKSS